MTNQLNLKELERKAFRATFQDGLWDIYMGLVVIGMGIFIHQTNDEYGPKNIFLMLSAFCLAYLVFWMGKKYVTIPRMGQVVFGSYRRRKKTSLAFALGVFIALQIVIVIFTSLGWINPLWGGKINTWLPIMNLERFGVAIVGALFVGPSMIVMAYFKDFPRGYYIAILMALAVFLMISQNQPIYPFVLGGLIVLPGIILFIRFLGKYPNIRDEVKNEEE